MSNIEPMNIEIEEAILGGLLLDPNAIARVIDTIETEAFVLEAHKVIYRACLSLVSDGKECSLMEMATFLSNLELLENIGGMTKLTQLVSRTVSAVNIDRYVQVLMDKYQRRKLIELGHDLVTLGYDEHIELAELKERAWQQFLAWNENQDLNRDRIKPIEVSFKRSEFSLSKEVIETVEVRSMCDSFDEVGNAIAKLKSLPEKQTQKKSLPTASSDSATEIDF